MPLSSQAVLEKWGPTAVAEPEGGTPARSPSACELTRPRAKPRGTSQPCEPFSRYTWGSGPVRSASAQRGGSTEAVGCCLSISETYNECAARLC